MSYPFEKKVLVSLKPLVVDKPGHPGQAICVACSGGLDSMVLLASLHALGVVVSAIHVNHRQRDDALLDEKLVRDFCKNHKIPFTAVKLKAAKGASEKALRDLRYEALLTSGHAVIATAHHLQDNLETYLFRLIRGADPTTIQGIPSSQTRKGVRFIRPLLKFSKDEIKAYAVKHDIPWREDSSNQSLKFARNRIRHELLPLLEDLRPGSEKRILTFFESLQTLQPEKRKSELDISKNATIIDSRAGLPIHGLDFLHLKSILDHLLGEMASRTKKAHWQSLERQLSSRNALTSGKGPIKLVQFPGGFTLRFQGDRLYWTRAD